MIPSGSTLYSFRGQYYPSVLVRGKVNLVKLPAYRTEALVAPASATYTLVNSSGQALVSAAACTISASIAQYSIPSASIPDGTLPGEGYQERWVFTFSGEPATVEVIRPAAVAVAPIYPVVTTLDLYAQYPKLADYLAGSLTSYQPTIDEAWGMLMARLIRQGRLPYCVRTPDALRECHLYLTLTLVFQSFGMGVEGEHWRALKAEQEQNYKDAYQALTVQIDANQDRLVDNPTQRDSGPIPTFFTPNVTYPNSNLRRRV